MQFPRRRSPRSSGRNLDIAGSYSKTSTNQWLSKNNATDFQAKKIEKLHFTEE